MDFSKFDSMIDLDGLKKDVENASAGGDREYKEVPHGAYEVAVTKLELTETKQTHKPMVSCWFKVVSDGEYNGNLIFMNQVITQGFQIHIANQFLKSLIPDGAIDVVFESFSQYSQLLMDIAEHIDKKYEYALDYGENSKGYATFEITEVFELE